MRGVPALHGGAEGEKAQPESQARDVDRDHHEPGGIRITSGQGVYEMIHGGVEI